MGWLNEAARGIIGSIRCGWGDEQIAKWYNLSLEGFWRSFSAIIPIAPLFIYPVFLDLGPMNPPEQPGVVMALLVLAVQWVLWPLVMVPVSKKLNLAKNYARYITVYNWSTVVMVAATAIPLLCYDFALISAQGAANGYFMILCAVMVYRWLMTHETLHCNGMIAAVLVAADFAISMLVNQLML